MTSSSNNDPPLLLPYYASDDEHQYLYICDNSSNMETDTAEKIFLCRNNEEIMEIIEDEINTIVTTIKTTIEIETVYFDSHDSNSIDENTLSNYLKYFYSNLKTENDKNYAPASLICIRSSIYRYFGKLRGFDIINDKKYMAANQVLLAQGRKYVNEGGCRKQYQAIEKNDLSKLRIYFDRSNPAKLV